MCCSLLWAITGHLFMMDKFLSTLFSSLGEKSRFSQSVWFDPCPLASVAKTSAYYQMLKYFQFPNTIKFSCFITVKCIKGIGTIRLTESKIFMIATLIERGKGNLLEDTIFWEFPVSVMVKAKVTTTLLEYSRKCPGVLRKHHRFYVLWTLPGHLSPT